VPSVEERSTGVVEAAFNPVAAAPEHFIRELDLALEASHLGSVARVEVGDLRCDAGLVATVVDVVGGHLAMHLRAPAFVATTHIELHGIDHLHGPGELIAEARLIGSSKRRAITEVSLRLGGMVALAHAGFAVRAVPVTEEQPPRGPRAGRIVDRPLWERIGVEDDASGARVSVAPFIHNHVGALQGGAMMSLLERAALLAAGPGHVVTDATINYLAQAKTDLVRAVATAHHGDVVSVDGIGEGFEGANARAVFRLRPDR
jgi:acyl-coenzyme A thioesterase PaaI-like protein